MNSNDNVSSTDSTDENLASTASISISFLDDENEKPSQALTKIQSDEEKIVDFSAFNLNPLLSNLKKF